MIQDFIVPFIAISLAELGDKTQIAVFCLASQTKRHLALLSGVMLGFIIADGIAIILGGTIADFIPLIIIKFLSGIIFIIFGILILSNKREKEERCRLRNPFISGFTIILISEIGDKTQIASGLFAAQFRPFFVFLSIIISLLLISILAIFAGKIIDKNVSRNRLKVASGIIFIIIGILSIIV